MNGDDLKQAIQEMPETGIAGFEGLVKRLLELALGEVFVLARSGDQPSGDAHNSRRNLSVQAKRYGGDAVPNAKLIEGDFDQCLRTLPNTDIYVLAVTRETAQLDDTLHAMREKSAVDVVVWDFAGDDSALPVLCVEHWAQLQDFAALKAMDGTLGPWLVATRGSPRHKELLGHIQQRLRECTQTLADIRKAASSYLRRRFQLDAGAPPLPLQSIHLGAAVNRLGYSVRVAEWWRANQLPVAVLNGPEGHGKTWVAAQCAITLNEQEELIVLWLDSLQWRECASVDDVLTAAVSRLGLGDDHKMGRLVRKIRERWSGRALVVLDGVSEREALPAAQRIIEDLTVKRAGRCRLLFTTRPLESARGYDSAIWSRWMEIKIEPFDDAELNSALTRAGISRAELPEHLLHVARIPRYFATCLRLRARLRGFDNIGVPLVLWTDLLDKISGLEPGIREHLGFTGETEAVDVLVKLATSLPDAVAKGKAQELLNQCFGGKYAEVRNYLKEIRIMEEARVFEANLNRHHTTLGLALFLHQVLRSLSGLGVRESADRLLATLEPLAGEDGSTEALFVALQLTAMGDTTTVALSQQRAALLYAWMFSHNSNASDERLAFWCGFDTGAYAQFVAAFFEQLYAGNAQELVANPLARLWADGGESVIALEPHLRRWLLLVWFDGCSGTELSHRGHQLPVARTGDEIRLASFAISLLSLRPDLRLLRDLALCLATDDLTWRQHGEHRSHFKSIHENVGVLMRWHYTEAVIPELERMAREFGSDELLLDGLRQLAGVLRLVEEPTILRRPPPEPFPYYFGTPPVELMRQGRRVFGCARTELHPNETDFSYLAVRRDLPPLSEADINTLCSAVEEISQTASLHADRGRTTEDDYLDALWPWYAKFRPLELARLAGRLQFSALKREKSQEVQPMFWFLAGMLPKLTDDEVPEWERLANDKSSSMQVTNRRLENYLGLSVAEAALLLLPEDAVHRWIAASADSDARRYSMCFAPLMDLIPLVLPDKTRQLAAAKCLELGDMPLRSDEGPPTELEYWCYIAALANGPNATLYRWARGRLLETSDAEKRNFSLLRLWLRSAPPGQLESDLDGPDAASLFDNRALRAWAVGGELPFNPNLLLGSYDELMRKLPQGFVGGVMALSGRDADLNQWGRELFAVAAKLLGKSPFECRSRVETQIRLGRNRMVRSVSFESTVAGSSAWSSNADSWGVDYGDMADVIRPGGSQELLDEELDRWRLDENRLEKWEHYELHTFGAWSALEKWSELFPNEFLPRAHSILKAACEKPSSQHHLGGFLQIVTCCLLPTAPSEAWDYYFKLQRGHIRLSVQTDYDIPEFYAVLWDLTRCKLPAHESLRRHLLAESKNEFEVMVQAVAALANGAEGLLTQFADELLARQLARDRSLGVSILAWVGTDASVGQLTRIAATDASRWVRRHAEWAREVSAQEKCSREFFRELLHEADPHRVSAGLQVLKPALTPLARWWRGHIMREEKSAGALLTPKVEAVLESFWYHVDSTHKSGVSVFGRKLGEFCRGERLDRLKTPKLAPWWNWS